MKNSKILLLATVAMTVLGTGFAPTPAHAFDKVKWKWYATVNETINENVNVNLNLTPTGLVQLEKSQKMIGNISAKSQVSHIANNPPPLPNGIDLPEVASIATGVGNNQSIDTEVSLNLDDSQKMIGNISATSEVAHILNASVNSAATAVGNNVDINMAGATTDDGIFIADVSQYMQGNLSATSKVSHVSVNGYSNLAALTVPMVNSTATAVGNNFAVKVNVPPL